MNITAKCLGCDAILYEMSPEKIREHLDSHPIEAFPVNYTEEGEADGYATLEGSFTLSCNCGECDFCRAKAAS